VTFEGSEFRQIEYARTRRAWPIFGNFPLLFVYGDIADPFGGFSVFQSGLDAVIILQRETMWIAH